MVFCQACKKKVRSFRLSDRSTARLGFDPKIETLACNDRPFDFFKVNKPYPKPALGTRATISAGDCSRTAEVKERSVWGLSPQDQLHQQLGARGRAVRHFFKQSPARTTHNATRWVSARWYKPNQRRLPRIALHGQLLRRPSAPRYTTRGAGGKSFPK